MVKIEGIYKGKERIGQELLADEKHFHVLMGNGNKEKFFQSIGEDIDFSLFMHHVKWARESNLGGYFFINVKPSTLVRYVDNIVHILSQKIVIEIREDALEERDIEKIKEIRKDFPFLLSIDDMGRGASNLDRVSELSPNFIKLDMEVIRKTPVSHLTLLVNFLRGFAPQSVLIAEKVETEQEYRMIKGAGIEIWQGWYERKCIFRSFKR